MFDTQVCFSVLMETRGYAALPIGLNKLLQKYLGDGFQNTLKESMNRFVVFCCVVGAVLNLHCCVSVSLQR